MTIDLPATLTFVLVAIFTPGPNNILAASSGALHGYRRTLPFLLGVVCGFIAVMTLCATLSSVLNRVLPSATPVLRLLGAAYILWLAWGVYASSEKFLETESDLEPLGLWSGMALQLVNPKGLLFGITVYSAFLAPLLDNTVALLLSPLLLAALAFVAISTWALGGQTIRRRLRTPRRARILGIVLALALVYTALDMSGILGLVR